MKYKRQLTVIIVLIVLFLAWYISTYKYQLTLIQGESMQPTFSNMSLVIINKYTNSFKNDEVIVFKNDKDVLVKRLVAIPGDKIVISDGQLFVNDLKVNSFESIEYAGNASDEIILKDNEYFVLGDNVNNSKDSRYDEVGIVHRKDIIGKIIM